MKARKSIADYIERQAEARRQRADRDHSPHADRMKIEATILDAIASDIRAELDVALVVEREPVAGEEKGA